MAALVSNLSRPLDLGAAELTRAVVAGADQAIIGGLLTGGGGINGSSSSNSFENEATATVTDDWYSAWAAFSGSAVDMSAVDSAFVCHYKVANPSFENVKAIRMCLRSGTGTTNWGIWEFAIGSGSGNDGFYHPCMMFGTPDSEVGTFDNTDVTGFCFQMQASDASVYAFACSVDQLVFIDGPAFFEDTGAAATLELEDYFDLVKQSSTEDYRTQLAKKAGPTFEFGFPFKIATDDYNSTAVAEGVAFREADDFAYPAMPSGFFQLIIECPASGTQVFDNFTAATNSVAYNLTIDGTAASSSLTITSGLFAGVNDAVVDGANVTLSSCTIASPATAEIGDGDLDINITGSTAAIDWAADLVAGSSITTDSDIDITFAETDLSDITVNLTASNTVTVSPTTGSGAYDLSGLTTTGTANFDNATANDTTVTLPSGTSNTVESPTAGGGAIEVDNAVTVTVSVTALDEGLTAVSGAAVYLEAATGGPLPFQESATITRSGSTATVTHTAHGLATNDEVKIRGADQDEYNIAATVTVTGANTYTYTVTGTPTTPATGTITSTYVILNGTTNGSGVLEDTAFTYTSDQPISGTVRKSTSSPYYKPGVIAGTIASAGLSSTVILVSDE